MMLFNFDVCISIVLEEHLYFHGKEQTGCLNMSFFLQKGWRFFPKIVWLGKQNYVGFFFLIRKF